MDFDILVVLVVLLSKTKVRVDKEDKEKSEKKIEREEERIFSLSFFSIQSISWISAIFERNAVSKVDD